MLVRRLLCLCVLSLLSVSPVYADTTTLTADASYIMGDGETPSFAEAMALQRAKQTALEEAGTYVQSYTKSLDQDLTVDEIQTIAGGVLQVEVLEKTRSLVADGLRFYTKIKATVTTDKMEELVRRIKGKNVAEEYTQLQGEYARLSHELEGWKQRAAKAAQGPERDAVLDRIQDEAKAFVRVQQREADLFQRIVSGKQLVAEAGREKEIIDELLNMIVTSGYVVTVGEVQSVLVPADSSRLSLNVPLTLRLAETIHGAMSQAVEVLGGSLRSARVMLKFWAPSVWERADTGDRARTMVTLVRLGRDRETTQYFQERVGRLAFDVTFLDGTRELDRCRLYAWTSTQHELMSWSPLGRIVPVSRVHTLNMPHYPKTTTYVEVPDVYQSAHPTENREPYVAIGQDEVAFVAHHNLPADAVHSLTGVRVMVRLMTDHDLRDLTVTSCTVVGNSLIPG